MCHVSVETSATAGETSTTQIVEDDDRMPVDAPLPIDPPRVMNVNEAAELVGISPAALRRRVDRGTLQAVHHGSRVMIPRVALMRAGLIPSTEPSTEEQLAAKGTELVALSTQLDTLRRECAGLRAELDAKALVEPQLHEARALAGAAEARLDAERIEAAERIAAAQAEAQAERERLAAEARSYASLSRLARVRLALHKPTA